MKEYCSNCKFNTFSRASGEFACGNPDSENYGVPTAYDDVCDDYEEKDD